MVSSFLLSALAVACSSVAFNGLGTVIRFVLRIHSVRRLSVSIFCSNSSEEKTRCATANRFSTLCDLIIYTFILGLGILLMRHQAFAIIFVNSS